MDIGIVGAGNIGTTLAGLFTDAGHGVILSDPRGPQSLESTVEDLGPRAHAGDVEEAVRLGSVVVLALPFRNRESLPSGDLFAGKVVVDATTPDGDSAEMLDLPRTSSEYIAEQVPGARVVKTFDTMHWESLREAAGRDGEDRLALFLAGDDPRAKATVAGLVEDVGFAPVDTGTLVEGGRRQRPGTDLYDDPLTEAEARDRLSSVEPSP
ncbi:NADPH-dependent F420 reductase [Halomarina oriensis]|uniref:NADP oxidoreductase n=1 Tax=Halomarina oriensis TaxID=671145 RepID=A0A6B0GGM4_9EURY|nr:NADPH-dependent F420 reductase [Halomarina oriensis]MWG33884.1 NADP oxidoreductase [Halomarina oriensis]